MLSLIRFNQIDAVMNRLTGVSLPLVQSSLGVEAKTAELVVLATELSKAENEAQRFERMERLSDQIGQLWSVLSKLQTIISEETTAARLQQLVAAINTNIGDLDRSTREILLLGDRRSKAIDKAEAANEAALRLLLQVTDDILSRIGASVDRARQRPDRYAGPATRSCVAAHRLCRARRFQSRHHPAQRDRDPP